jgi:hypothetical protein
MNVLYFGSGLFVGCSVVANTLTQESAWGVLIVPALVMLAVATIMEHSRG